MLYGIIIVLSAFGFVRAIALGLRRNGDVRRLIATSSAPSLRLRDASDVAGIRIREVAAPGAVVMLAGLFRPIVLVSSDALDRINDAELIAAIRHEAAHARRGDLLCAAAVSFLADLVPLPVGSLIALHRRAREFAADAYATRVADPCDLACALIALARPVRDGALTAAFAESGTVRDRLGVLLARHAPLPSRARRVLVAFGLIGTLVLGAAPTLTAVILGFTCAMAMPV